MSDSSAVFHENQAETRRNCYFPEKETPTVSDGSQLAFYISNNIPLSKIPALMENLRQTNDTAIDTTGYLGTLLSHVIPPEFFNHLTYSPSNNLPEAEFYFSPYQKYIMGFVRKIISEMKSDENYDKFLDCLSIYMMPKQYPSPSSILICGKVKYSARKYCGIFYPNGTIELFSPSNMFQAVKQINRADLPQQTSVEWEMTQAEYESNLYIPTLGLFRSISTLKSFKEIPFLAYSAFMDLMTSPNLKFLDSLFQANIADVEKSLITVFVFTGTHRRLLKHAILEDIFSTPDPEQIMRRNTVEQHIVNEFIIQQMNLMIDPTLNQIKVKLAATAAFNLDNSTEEDMEIMTMMIDTFLEIMINVVHTIPSVVRFICKTIYIGIEERFGDTKYSNRGIFMALLFRYIFPLLCQPKPTDPAGLKIDPMHSSRILKVLTMVFNYEGKSFYKHIISLLESKQEKVQRVYNGLCEVPEDNDALPRPSLPQVMNDINELRRLFLPRIQELTYMPPKSTQIMRLWLKSLA